DDTHASAPVTFHRWEPIPSPAVVPLAPFSDGESLRRLVVRSLVGPEAQTRFAAAVAAGTFPADAAAERYLAAPKAAELTAERHGRFDAAFGPNATQADRDTAFEVAAREQGTYL